MKNIFRSTFGFKNARHLDFTRATAAEADIVHRFQSVSDFMICYSKRKGASEGQNLQYYIRCNVLTPNVVLTVFQ